ncbi:centrosomal protein of 83 kDa-like isoform X1 [Biomphalaria glabrata]|nr:centrosomal protein of 83 kDa-like isoform X1 [Biomphalaria glabrata]
MASTSFHSSHIIGGNRLIASNLSNQLPQLMVETELQKLLSDEKARAEKHKINYQQLKVEHTCLQEKLLELEAENKSTLEESRLVKEKYLSMFEACSRELAEKVAEINELKTKMITPQRLELIKSQMLEDLEKIYIQKSRKQEDEVEEYRAAMSKLRYELSFLKAEYEHNQTEHVQQMQDLVKQHDIELTNLRQDRDATITKIQTETGSDLQKVRVLQRDNAQLNLQVKELLNELEEVRALKEKLSLESDNIMRTHTKQVSEQISTIRSLESERESLKRQIESIHHELTAVITDQNKLRGELHEVETKNTILKNHAEETIHRSKVDLSNLKMDMLKQRGELEKERDRLRNELEDMKQQLDISQAKVLQLQHLLEEKERDAVLRVQAAREEEFSKIVKVENEKFELETKLQEMERRRIDDEARRHADQEKANDRVSQANAAKDQAERELISIKARLGHMESLESQVERERSENSLLKSQVYKLQTEINGFHSAENELADSNMKIKNNAELLREELQMTKSQLEQLQNNHQVILMQQRSAMADDRVQLEGRIHELEEKLNESLAKYNRASVIHKKLKTKTALITEKLKDKLMLLKAQNTELDLEKKALQKCVPFDKYNRLHKQWKDLWRRHNEFRTILFSIPSSSSTSYKKKVSEVLLDASTVLQQSGFDNELEEQHQEDLKVLRLRLEALDKVQHQQLAELIDLTPREKQDIEKDVCQYSGSIKSDEEHSIKSNES